MENHQCPHCQTSIRGLQVFKLALPKRGKPAVPNGAVRCPGCDKQLLVLPNRWQLWGFLLAILTILPRMFIARAEFPNLWMVLAIGTMVGFVMAAIGIFYLPRYRATT